MLTIQPTRKMGLIIFIESARALLDLPNICRCFSQPNNIIQFNVLIDKAHVCPAYLTIKLPQLVCHSFGVLDLIRKKPAEIVNLAAGLISCLLSLQRGTYSAEYM